MVDATHGDLANVVSARHPASRLSGSLDRRQQKPHEYTDNGDNHQ
jgi:hypothetical protein